MKEELATAQQNTDSERLRREGEQREDVSGGLDGVGSVVGAVYAAVAGFALAVIESLADRRAKTRAAARSGGRAIRKAPPRLHKVQSRVR